MTNRKLSLKSCAVRGPAGRSAYDAAMDAGYTGTAEEFYSLLVSMPEMISQFEEMTQQLQEIKDYFDELYARGFSESARTALLALLEHAGFADTTGQQLYDNLEEELFPPVDVVSIAATFDQGQAVIYDTDSLFALKPYLTVMATFEDHTVRRVTDYALSGTLTAGTSTITVTYGGQSDTFDVVVTHDARDVLISISAVYTQSGTVYDTDSLDSLKSDLVVTATYGDSSTQTVPAESYTLSGTLAEGTSTITVSYGGKTTTFNVEVTENPTILGYVSDGLMALWDGIKNAGMDAEHDSSTKNWVDVVSGKTLTPAGDGSGYAFADKYLNITATASGNQERTGVALSLDGFGLTRTVEILFQTEATAAQFIANMTGDTSTTANGLHLFGITPSDGTLLMKGNEADGRFAVQDATAVVLGSATYDSNNACTGYINGQAATISSNVHSFSIKGSLERSLLLVGSSYYYSFKGKIFSIRIYNRELTAAEIAANYANDVARFGLGA